MVKIFVKQNGKQTPIEDCDYVKIEDNVIELIEKIAEKINPAIEINFVRHGTIGNEMLLDPRLNHDLIKPLVEELNKLGGTTIYSTGTLSDPLLEGHKHKKISYISFFTSSATDLIRLTLHELFHFEDPFPRDIECFTILETDLYYRDNKLFIKNEVRSMLNEYHANYKSYDIVLQYINIFTEDHNLILDLLKERTLRYIKDIDDKLLNQLKSLEGEDVNSFEGQQEILDFLIGYFFKQFMYFFGSWRAFKENNYETEPFRKTFEELKIIYIDLASFLITLQEELLKPQKYQKLRLIERYYTCRFLEFFHITFPLIIHLASIGRL